MMVSSAIVQHLFGVARQRCILRFHKICCSTLKQWRFPSTEQARSLSTSDRLTKLKDQSNPGIQSADQSTFTPVYRLKYIVHLKVLSRLKIYQTALTLVGLPIAGHMYNIGDVSTEAFAVCCSSSVLACVMLYIISLRIRKAVGLLSLSNDENKVMISHLTFWGKRNNVICDLADIAPLSDVSESPSDIFVRLRRYSTKEELHLYLRHGLILDQKKLECIVGALK